MNKLKLSSKMGFLFIVVGMAFQVQAIPQPGSKPIERELLHLQAELRKEANTQQKFQTLQSSLLTLREYLQKYPAPTPAQQGKINLLVSVLESLPTAQTFKKTECAKYEDDFLEQFEPMAEEVPSDPSVLYGWDTLQRLCH